MRKIKFRAWDLDKKEFYIPVIDSEGKSALLWYGYEIQGQTEDPLMQFTGLKDKNGKEIYEMDIVKHQLSFTDKRDVFGVVEFSQYDDDEQYSTWIHLGWHVLEKSLADIHSHCEVIGNIYQNHELLEKNNGTN